MTLIIESYCGRIEIANNPGVFEMATSQKDAQKKQINLKTLTVGDLTWVDIVQPTKETAEYLAEQYNFHPMDLEDALSVRQLSKIEEYPQYLFVVFHFQVYEKMTRISTRRQWSAFVGDKFLITLHPAELKAVDDIFRDCELSANIRDEYLGRGSGFLLYQILDRLLDSYFPVLDKIAGLLQNIEDNVFNEQIEAAEELSISASGHHYPAPGDFPDPHAFKGIGREDQAVR